MPTVLRTLLAMAMCALVLAGCESSTDVAANRHVAARTTDVRALTADGTSTMTGIRRGVTTTHAVVLRNTSTDATVEITSVALHHGNRGLRLATVPTLPVTLPPTATLALDVEFDGQFNQADAGTDRLVVNGDTTNAIPLRVTTVAVGSRLVVTPDPVDFGAVDLGTIKERTVTVSLENVSGSAEVYSIDFVNGRYFTIIDPPVLPMLLDAAQPSVTFTVRCTPGDTNVMEDILSINGTAATVVTASLPAANADIYVEHQNLGLVARDVDIPIEVRVRNASSGSASVGSIRALIIPDGIQVNGIGGFDGYPMTIPANGIGADDGTLRIPATLPAGTYTITFIAAIQATDTGATIREVGDLTFIVQ